MTSPFLFGTVGSPLSTPAKPGGTIGGIQRTAALGLSTLELAWVRAVRISPAACEAIRAEAARSAVALSIHAPYFINLNADSTEWPKSRNRIMDAAHFGRLAGATDIVIHPGSYFKQDPDTVLSIAVKRLQGCIADLRAEDNPVILRPETMGKGALIGSLEDTLRMSAEVPGVLPCIDFAHLHARTGSVEGANSYDSWMQMMEQIGKRLGSEALQKLHIHLSGIAYTAKGERHHLPFREADIRYLELLRALRDSGCSGRILCESPILEEDALLLRTEWENLSGND